MNEFDKKPDFINKDGIKWWFDKSTTKYLHSKKLEGSVFVIENKKKIRTRVLIQDNEVVYENQDLSQFAAHIDMLAISKKFK